MTVIMKFVNFIETIAPYCQIVIVATVLLLQVLKSKVISENCIAR